jgi:hypothetical protein
VPGRAQGRSGNDEAGNDELMLMLVLVLMLVIDQRPEVRQKFAMERLEVTS